MLRPSLFAVLLLSAALVPAEAQELGDAAAGKAYFEAECAECHRAARLTGERGSKFVAGTDAIAAGKAKHKPRIKLTPKAVADLTAFLQSGT